ncbi:MAG: Altered inheritance of mitochondria protein 6 [Bathelium mastoideum]|nr:MAG: Altered inheritance of mitochondria protein 6 [Bathelium mastoideum]
MVYYWRDVPLFDAIKHGCTSVEADVWLFDDDNKLYVGHDTASLTPWRTFESLYVHPILKLLEMQNQHDASTPQREPRGLFEEDPSQTLILLVDFKTFGPDLLTQVKAQIEPLRSNDYLTYFNGTSLVYRPITVVGTGSAPFDIMAANTSRRDIFFDAPLEYMQISSASEHQRSSIQDISSNYIQQRGQGHTGTAGFNSSTYGPANSFYASTSFTEDIGYPWWFGTLTNHQLDLIRRQIRGAHEQGLQVRFWGTPSRPKSVRNYIWSVLLDEGVDILNADDLDEVRDTLSEHQRVKELRGAASNVI